MCLFLEETEAKGPQFFFFETGYPLSQRLDDQHPLPPPPSNPLLSKGLDRPLRACLQANFWGSSYITSR